MLDKLGETDVWITKAEYEDWNVQKSSQWEVMEVDIQKEMIKIRRIDNARGTSKEV